MWISSTLEENQDTSKHWRDKYSNLNDCATKTRSEVAAQTSMKNKMATQTSKIKNMIMKTKMGHKHFRHTPNRGTGKTIGPWAKFCCGPKTPTHNRSGYSGRKDMPKVSEGGDRRIWRRGQGCLKEDTTPQSNITIEEHKAVAELRKDNNRMTLTAEKGVSLVVMNKEDYVKRAEELLNQPTYRTIPSDPTTKYQNKPVNLLKTTKAVGGISDAVYRRL